jgi:transcriptional regulator with XRE-family HTH domain
MGKMVKIHKRDEDVYEIIASTIKEKRKEAKITQAELAERSNYSHEFIRRIEAPNGKKYFSINTLVKLSQALGVKVEELLKGINNEDK